MKITSEWVEDLVRLEFGDGTFYATHRLITRCEDIRSMGGGCTANFGWVDIGPAIPIEGSLPFPIPPERRAPWWRRWWPW